MNPGIIVCCVPFYDEEITYLFLNDLFNLSEFKSFSVAAHLLVLLPFLYMNVEPFSGEIFTFMPSLIHA